MWATAPDMAPMRLIVPGFQGLSYHMGQVECALQGFITGFQHSLNRFGWALPGWERDFHIGLEERPDFCPDPENKEAMEEHPDLRWHELGHSFVDAVRRGTWHDTNPAPVNADPEEWVARLWKSRDYWLITGGSRIARRPVAPVRFRLPELPAGVRHAIEFDAETLAMKATALERTPQGIHVTVNNGFSAILLPMPDCPAVVQLADSPPLKPGASCTLELTPFAPWRNRGDPVSVRVEVLGITTEPVVVSLPGSAEISVPPNIAPGWYMVRVTGDCLRVKRWLRIVP
jgi:hypothetical protein